MQDKFLKLTNTVYKLLEFFPESDPLRSRAKDKALAIMENLTLLGGTKRLQGWATVADVFSEEKTKVQLLEDIDILSGYLWIGKSQGWLNSVNCLIVANEYEKIRKEIEPTAIIMEFTQKLPGIDKITAKNEQIEPEKHIDAVLDNTFDISSRQRQILEFLGKNEKAQVMDLQTILPDVTKRTIRRDLDELLELGKIVRLGDFNEVFYELNR